MDPIHGVRYVFTSNLSIIAHLFAVIIAVALLVQLVAMLVAMLVTIVKILVLGPIWVFVRALIIALKLLKIVILVHVWSVCSVVQGVMALLMLFGLCESRHGRAEPSGGDGDGKLITTSRQEANLASVRNSELAGDGEHAGRVYILFPGGPDRGGNNVGIVVDGTNSCPGAWPGTASSRDNPINLERHVARERALMPSYAGRP